MSLGDVSSLILTISIALYLVLGIALLVKGWIVRAGVVMAATSLLPLTWQVIFTDSDAAGFAFFLVLMLPPALMVAAGGVGWWLFQKIERASAGL